MKNKLAVSRLILILFVALPLTLVFFQNCSGKAFEVETEKIDLASNILRVPQSNAVLTLTQKPGELINQRNAEFRFEAVNAPAGAQTYCRLDSEVEVLCPGVFTAMNLADEMHSFSIQLRDSAGTLLTSLSDTFRVDATGPVIVVNEAPGEFSGKDVSVSYTVADNLSLSIAVNCSLDSDLVQPCSSPKQYLNLAAGNHQIRILASDELGNYSEKIISFKVDLSAPTVTLSEKPEGVTSSMTAKFSFVGNEASLRGPYTYFCKLDDGSAANCTSPVELENLMEGTHKFQIIAKGKNGVESLPLFYQWSVDQTPPEIIFSKKPRNPSAIETADFAFSANDSSGIKSYACRLLGVSNSFVPCVSPYFASNLVLGEHEFAVMATDNAGNISESKYSWTLIESLMATQQRFVSIASGLRQTCGITLDGQVKCWGDVVFSTPSPVLISGFSNAAMISVLNSVESCMVDKSENLKCRTDGAIDNRRQLSAVKMLTKNCALSGGEVYCWGYNSQGQAGTTSFPFLPEPMKVSGLSDVSYLSGSTFRNCAVVRGEVFCWGQNYDQLMKPTSSSYIGEPTKISGLTGVKSVAVADDHICAMTTAGQVRCFGNNSSLQLGYAGPADGRVVPLIEEVASLALANTSSCALMKSGDVYCWGSNGALQLGVDRGALYLAPSKVNLEQPALAVTMGLEHTCVLLTDRSVQCWGMNASGQLGLNGNSAFEFPSRIEKASGATSISVDPAHTCAVNGSKKVLCWGAGGYGQLGSGETKHSSIVPYEVVGLTNIKQVSTQGIRTCALSEDGVVSCWGYPNFLPVALTGMGVVTEITSGSVFSCGLNISGEVFCWGQNFGKTLGKEERNFSSEAPVKIEGLSMIKQISAGAFYVCGLGMDEKVRCWGQNYRGQLGMDDLSIDVATPTEVATTVRVTAISAGSEFVCAVGGDRKVLCWGQTPGQDIMTLQDRKPRQITNLMDVTQVASGLDHACAMKGTGEVFCWGSNSAFQFGKITERDNFATPIRAFRGVRVKSLVGGSSQSRVSAFVGLDNTVRATGIIDGAYTVPAGSIRGF